MGGANNYPISPERKSEEILIIKEILESNMYLPDTIKTIPEFKSKQNNQNIIEKFQYMDHYHRF
jgi:hypothetical protein